MFTSFEVHVFVVHALMVAVVDALVSDRAFERESLSGIHMALGGSTATATQ